MRQPKHQFKAPAFQLYAKEFLADEAVIVMDLDAVGAFIVLLCHQWIEGSIPADQVLLARICRTTPERMQAIWPQVASKFPPKRADKTRLANTKLEIVRSEKQRFSAKQSTSGTRGARKRWSDNPNPEKQMDGVAQESAMGSAWADDSSGSGSGSVNNPLPPSFEGDGAGAPLVLTSPDLDEKPQSKAPSYQPFLEEVAGAIHGRHPKGHGRRDLGVDGTAKKLVAILKHRKIPTAEAESYLRRIDRNHAGACASEQWRKDGGEFAKSLSGWLAPREGRYDREPEMPARKEPVRLMA